MCQHACYRNLHKSGGSVCLDCQRGREDQHERETLVNSLAARDPEADPTHKAATDREWWDFIGATR